MAPQVDDYAEVEGELHEMTLHDWIESHPHFIPALTGIFEEVDFSNICRFFFMSGGFDIFRKLAIWINSQPILVNPQDPQQTNWLKNVTDKIDFVEKIGQPNTDNAGNPIPITANMRFDAHSLHADAIEDLHGKLEHNHSHLVNKGQGHYDPQTHATWTQFGVAQPTGYNPDGTPHPEYNFTPHDQWGGNLYGQQGHPQQPIAGGHTEQGSGLLGLFNGVKKLSKLGGAAGVL
jgi:hypothetical protein